MEELTIADAAARTGLSVHTLRYYERAGLLPPVARATSGHRRFRERDLEWLEFLSKLRSTGMPIREVRRYVELVRAGDETRPQRLAMLEAHRDAIHRQRAEIDRCLDLIDHKVAIYREMMPR